MPPTTKQQGTRRGRKCESEFPFIAGDEAVMWFRCQKRGKHRVCRYDGMIYDNASSPSEITLRWRSN